MESQIQKIEDRLSIFANEKAIIANNKYIIFEGSVVAGYC